MVKPLARRRWLNPIPQFRATPFPKERVAMPLTAETLFKVSPRAVLHYSLPEGCTASIDASSFTITLKCGDEQSRREALVRVANLLMRDA